MKHGATQEDQDRARDNSPWSYSARIPEGWSSRSLAVIVFSLGLVGDSLGIFLAHDAGQGRVDFWSNFAVLLGLFHLIYCACIGSAMLLGRWVLTAPQAGLIAISLLSVSYFLQGASALGIVFYSSASVSGRIAIAAWFFGWHGWWVWSTVKGCRRIWQDRTLRDSVWVQYDMATVYRREVAKQAMAKVKMPIFVGKTTLLLVLGMAIPMLYLRQELTAYFGVPIIHVILSVAASPLALIGTVPATFSIILMMVYPAKIVGDTERPVLFDMMTK